MSKVQSLIKNIEEAIEAGKNKEDTLTILKELSDVVLDIVPAVAEVVANPVEGIADAVEAIVDAVTTEETEEAE